MVKQAFHRVLPTPAHSSFSLSYVIHWHNTSEIKDEFADQTHVSWIVASQRLGKREQQKSQLLSFCGVWLDYHPPTQVKSMVWWMSPTIQQLIFFPHGLRINKGVNKKASSVTLVVVVWHEKMRSGWEGFCIFCSAVGILTLRSSFNMFQNILKICGVHESTHFSGSGSRALVSSQWSQWPYNIEDPQIRAVELDYLFCCSAK